MYEIDIEVCPVCHFRLPQIMHYAGTIHCHCGKVVYSTDTIMRVTPGTINFDAPGDNISCLSHSSLLSL